MKKTPIGNRGLYRIYKATIYSMSGIALAFKNESAFRQDILLCIVLISASLYINDLDFLKIQFLILSSFILLITEILNSAIEWNVDLATQEIHPMAKGAKDMGSAAVFFALCNIFISFIYSL